MVMNSGLEFVISLWDLVEAATEACLSCHDAACHFLTSLWDKESRHKALNQIGHTALPITVDNICRLTTKVKLLLRASAVSNLPLLRNGNESVTHPHLLSKGFAWAEVQLLDRHCGRSFSFALLQSEIYKKEMLG